MYYCKYIIMYNNYLSAASELTKYEENASDQMGDSKG
jgi:hypothetical protein